MYLDFDRSEGHLGAKIGPKSDLGAILGAKIGPKVDLGAILGAKIGPRWSQNRSKIAPRRNQEGQKRKAATPRRPKSPPNEIFHAMVLGRGAGFGTQNRPKSVQRWVPKLILFLIPFLIDFGSQNGFKNRPGVDQKSVSLLCCLVAWLLNLGLILHQFSVPKLIKNQSKVGEKSGPKID